MGWLESQQSYFKIPTATPTSRPSSSPNSSSSSGSGWLESQQSYFSQPHPVSTPVATPQPQPKSNNILDELGKISSNIGSTANNLAGSVGNAISNLGSNANKLRTDVANSHPLVKQIGDFLNSMGSAPLKGQDSGFLDPDGKPVIYSGDTPKDVANIILANLPALIPMSGASAVTGFSKIRGAAAAAAQAGLQIVGGTPVPEVLKNLPFGFLGGVKLGEEPISFTTEEVKTEVINTDLKNTPLGKELIKTSFKADPASEDVQISHDPGSNLKTPGGLPVKVEIVPKSLQDVKSSDTLKSNDQSKLSNTEDQNNPKGVNSQSNLSPQNELFSAQDTQHLANPENNGHETNQGVESGNIGQTGQPGAGTEPGGSSEPGKLPQEQLDNKAPENLSDLQEPTKPSENLTPVGEGETKTSSLGSSVAAKAVEKKLTDNLGELPQYKEVSMKDQAQKATDLLNTDSKTAIDIALGRAKPPEGLLPEAVYTAVENKAIEDGSISLLKQLSESPLVSEATAMGQRIRTLAERNPESPVDNIKAVADSRAKAVEKKTGKSVDKATKEEVAKIKDSVKPPSKNDWSAFIDSLKC